MTSSGPLDLPAKPELSAPPFDPATERLGIPFILRVPVASGLTFLTGMFLGSVHGSRNAAMRYRAENAHRFPTTSTGWFLYHKSKNYHATIGGVKDGIKMGWKLSIWSAGFFALEECMDKARRGRRDFMSTVVAGLTMSGLFSLKGRQDIYTAARTAKIALMTSLAFGLMQDALFFAKGNDLAYVDFVKRKIWPKKDDEANQLQ